MIREGSYVLGLRLGVASLGWCALALDEREQPASVMAMGVRKFPIGAAGDVASGREAGPNQRRQDARSTRVRLARRVERLREVWTVLQSAGLLPPGRFKARGPVIATLDGTDDRHPYRLRVAALDRALSPYELGRAIYHIAHRRGFQSNRRAPAKDDEELGVVKQGISDLETAMRAAGARTLGEYLLKLDGALRRRWTSRDMYRAEFRAIVAAQRTHHPVLTTGYVKRLEHALFFQRPLRSQSHKIGRCDLEPSRHRAQAAGLDAQEFRVLCRVNDLRIVDDVGAEIVELSSTQRMALLGLLRDGDATWPAVRKALGLPKTAHFNAERIDDERLIGLRTEAKLRKVLGPEVYQAMPEEAQRALVDDLLNIDDDNGLRRRLSQRMATDVVDRLLSVTLEPGCAALSHKALATLLPRLRAGVPYATARKEHYPAADHHKELTELPLVHDAYKHLSNPLVRRALSELRVVVNAIVKKYGRPRSIRVSLMRELRLGRKARERAATKMRARNKQRAKAAARVLADMGVQEPPRWMIDKVLLADECGWVCPFTGKTISMRSLVGGEPQFEMAHIVPLHQSLDDSFENKTLCHVSAITGNRSVEPKALRHVKTIDRFEKLEGPYAEEKLRRIRLTPEEIVKEFSEDIIASRMVDSCHASKLAIDYLARLYPHTRAAVTASRGAITSLVREACGLHRIDLPDGSHRRAALDAAVVAISGPTVVRRLTSAALGALPGRRRLDPGQVLPWETFTRDVAEHCERVVVSARVRRKVSGPLHEETFYRHDGKDGRDKDVYSVRKHLWQLTPTDVAIIVGPGVRSVVEEALGRLGQSDPRKAFLKKENLPVYRGSQMRAVRIRRTDELFVIGQGPHARHVAVERNHHVAVFMRPGRGGKMMADRVVVSQFDAQTRLVRRQAVVQHPVGAEPCPNFRTLSVSETLECPWLDGAARFQTVRSVGKDPSVALTTLEDARTLAEVNANGAKVRMSVEQLRQKGAKKIVVTPLGDVRPCGD